VGSRGAEGSDEVESYTKDMIVARLNDVLGENLKTVLDLPRYYDELSEALKARVKEDFSKYGLELVDFFIGAITPPEEVQKVIDEKSGMAAVGNMGSYMQFKAAKSMEEAAANPSGNGAASGMGLGVGAGMGMMIPGMIGQAMNQAGQQAGAAAAGAGAKDVGTSVLCSSCGQANTAGSKFCSGCGKPIAGPGIACPKCGTQNPKESKFCNNCGQPMAPSVVACKECQTPNPAGAKFCSSCGKPLQG
jgi:membrane protease subunit (stomatin/prohibitin family)